MIYFCKFSLGRALELIDYIDRKNVTLSFKTMEKKNLALNVATLSRDVKEV